jgi:hypothetical protein
MEGLKTKIESLKANKHVTKTDKTEINELISKLDKIKDDSIIEGLREAIKKSKYSKKSIEKLNELIKDIKNDDKKSQEEINESINNTIQEIEEIEEEKLEDELDKECERYTKFNKSNPAEYINYDKANNNYVLKINKITKISKKLEKLIKIKKENFLGSAENFIMTKKIKYKNKKIMIYLTKENDAYFDINHVINLLDDIKRKDVKYLEHKNEIKVRKICDNEYGGFYVKEYINQEAFYNILLNTTSIFGKKFKKDVAGILAKLTKSEQIIIKDDKLEVNENKLVIKSPEEHLNEEYIYNQTYENDELLEYVKYEIRRFKRDNWIKYMDKPVMYFFISTLKDPEGINRILCKIGETGDILDRIKSIKYEYKCKFYLIGLKLINRQQDEKQFHKLLKSKHKEMVVKLKIGVHDKDETYVFDTELYKTYLEYVNKREFDKEDIKIEEEAKKIMNNYFENIEERFEGELIKKQSQIIRL